MKSEHEVKTALAQLDVFVKEAQAEQLPEFIGALARLQAIGLARVMSPPPATPASEDRLLEMSQVAERLGIKVELAREMGRRGELPVVYVGERRVRVRESALANWIKVRETGRSGRI